MTASYSTSLATNKDKVRFQIGDRDTSAALFSDEEISAVLVTYPDVVEASCELLESLLSEYAHNTSTSNVGISIGAERYQQLSDRLAKLRRISASRAWTKPVAITVGGRLITERDAQKKDTDLIQPSFRTDQYDHPGVTTSGDEEICRCD